MEQTELVAPAEAGITTKRARQASEPGCGSAEMRCLGRNKHSRTAGDSETETPGTQRSAGATQAARDRAGQNVAASFHESPSEKIAATFLQWLDAEFPTTNGELRDVSLAAGVPSFGQQLKFVGRDIAMADCKRLLAKRFESRLVTDKRSHPVGIVCGAAKLGKSRVLQEAIQVTRKFAAQNGIPWVAPVIINYLEGNPPSTDRELNNPSLALALRILYFAFRHDMQNQTFDDFVRAVPVALRKKLSPWRAISILQAAMNAKYALPKGPNGLSSPVQGIVYLAVDDTNALYDDTHPLYDTQARAFLSMTLLSLRSLLYDKNVFVFALVASRTGLRLEHAFGSSSAIYDHLKLHLLGWEDLARMMTDLETRDTLWAGWRTDTKFKQLLVDFGPLPGLAVSLLEQCAQARQHSSWGELPYDWIRRQLQQKIAVPEDPFAYKLIEDAVLGVWVRRGQQVIHDSLCSYETLETEGKLVLGSMTGLDHVQLIRPIFDQLLDVAARESHAAQALREALRSLPMADHGNDAAVDTAKPLQQQFERFAAAFEAVKEMMWHRHETSWGQPPKCTFTNFYGSGAVWCEDLEMTVSPDVQIGELQSDVAWDNQATVMVNTDRAAPINTFRVREMATGEIVLVMGRQKLCTRSDASLTRYCVKEELKKAEATAIKLRDSLPPEQQCRFQYRLVILATSASQEFSQFASPVTSPAFCLVLTGPSLRKYFGTVLIDRLFVALDNR